MRAAEKRARAQKAYEFELQAGRIRGDAATLSEQHQPPPQPQPQRQPLPQPQPQPLRQPPPQPQPQANPYLGYGNVAGMLPPIFKAPHAPQQPRALMYHGNVQQPPPESSKDQVIEQMQGQLAMAQSEIMRLRAQNARFAARLRELAAEVDKET